MPAPYCAIHSNSARAYIPMLYAYRAGQHLLESLGGCSTRMLLGMRADQVCDWQPEACNSPCMCKSWGHHLDVE